MVHFNEVNVIVENKSAQKSQHWIERICSTLNYQQYNANNDSSKTYADVKSKYYLKMEEGCVDAMSSCKCQVTQELHFYCKYKKF